MRLLHEKAREREEREWEKERGKGVMVGSHSTGLKFWCWVIIELNGLLKATNLGRGHEPKVWYCLLCSCSKTYSYPVGARMKEKSIASTLWGFIHWPTVAVEPKMTWCIIWHRTKAIVRTWTIFCLCDFLAHRSGDRHLACSYRLQGISQFITVWPIWRCSPP
jgi:hypothetical protein